MKVMMRIAVLLIALGASATALAHTQQFTATLSGPAEAPPNASPGVGSVIVTIDFDLLTMQIDATFSGLTAAATNAHIHCCTSAANIGTAGVATTTPTFPLFPTATSGEYHRLFDLTQASTFNASFVTANGGLSGALNAFALGLTNGNAYFNIHTSSFPGGEIRGFLAPAPVPLPAAVWLLSSGLLTLLPWRRRRAAR